MGRPRREKAKPKNPSLQEDSDSDDDFEPKKQYASPSSSGSSRKKMVGKKTANNNKENLLKGKKKAGDPKAKVAQEEKKEEVFWNENVLRPQTSRGMSYSSCHIVHYLRNVTQGTQPVFWQDQALNTPVMHTNKQLRVHRTYLGFDRRATALAWHPTNPNVVAVGSKGGDIILWNYQLDGNKPRTFIKGVGPGGSIQSLQFDERHSGYKAYTVSIDGTLAYHDLVAEEKENFLQTADIDHWYTALDVSVPGKVIIVGDNKGYVNLLTQDGEKLWTNRLHPQKVTHIEFCPRMPWCFVTASIDRSLKVWDIRNLKSRTSCLYSHMHEKPVNSAHFSRTDGGRLLTTDQHSEIRVYSCPSFKLSRTISHPHRQFQHLTPIKATWHPLRDIIVVGRYPDPAFPGYFENEPRTVDFFDGATGKLLHQHMHRGCDNKIISLNLFNQTGDALLSSAASLVWVWKPKFSCEYGKNSKSLDSEGNSDDDDDKDDKPKKPRKKSTNATSRKKAKVLKDEEPKVVRGIMKIDKRR
ncbi:DNA damage-binding protein 2-like isoform X1 [Penaeus japonicus]|uniref:DNA damage-binding protein 2-like isoform X1 n=1 Tax=Penaeus japonicus TaxID=27405 RepID=UPI001C70F47D|nr:DNA damage-binding protein 2-like isoform X1 [Penaeus japonicus]